MTGPATDLGAVASAVLATGAPGARPAGVVVGRLEEGRATLAAAGCARLAAPGEPGEPGEPMTTDHRVDLASVTKVVCTTALAARLVAAGDLDPDAPVAPLLPELPTGGDVTVADLLTHRGGLAPWYPLYCRTTDPGRATDLAARVPPVAAPRTRTVYSDLGFVLLGRLLARACGADLATAFARHVAGPLGLRRSGFGVPTDVGEVAAASDGDGIEREMVATGEPYPVDAATGDFDGWRSGVVRGAPADGNAAHALAGTSGHAGLLAPLAEVLTVGGALTAGTFLPDDVRARVLAPTADPTQGWGVRRSVLPDGTPAVGHPGFTGTWFAAATDRPLVLALAATRLHGLRPAPGRGLRASLTPVADLVAAMHAAAPVGAAP